MPTVNEVNGKKVVDIRAKSDAMIVDGLIVVLLTIFNGKTPAEILEADPEAVPLQSAGNAESHRSQAYILTGGNQVENLHKGLSACCEE